MILRLATFELSISSIVAVASWLVSADATATWCEVLLSCCVCFVSLATT